MLVNAIRFLLLTIHHLLSITLDLLSIENHWPEKLQGTLLESLHTQCFKGGPYKFSFSIPMYTSYINSSAKYREMNLSPPPRPPLLPLCKLHEFLLVLSRLFC